jgi:hypothetical protein
MSARPDPEREANRRAACERLVSDPAASPTEKAIAAKELERVGPTPTVRRAPNPTSSYEQERQRGRDWQPVQYEYGPWGPAWSPSEAEAAGDRAAETRSRAEESRRERESGETAARLRVIVNDQRRRVESLPFWREDPGLVRAHACGVGWDFEEGRIVDWVERGCPDVSASDEPGRVVLLASAWTLADLTDQERAWLRTEMGRLADGLDVSPRFFRWLARRAGVDGVGGGD